MLSVLILTYDEQVNVAACIESLPWRSDVYVLDSGSRDATVEIAGGLGATVVNRPFTNYAEQRNFGLSLPFRNEWIVSLDADERMTPELAHEVEERIAAEGAVTAMFRVRRKDIFMGRWLRRSTGYPTWFPRLFKRGLVRVEREINEVYIADGNTSQLREHIVHFPFNKGLDWWFERHNRYSTMEASVLANEKTGRLSLSSFASLDHGKRRAAFKALAYRLPGRPFLTFVYLYLVRLGCLDGRAGYTYACMRMAYEIMIDAKMADHRRARDSAARPGST